MAVEGIKQIIPGLICVTDLSALQYNLVKLNADFNVVAINGVTDYPIGVLDNAPVGTASVPAEASVTCFGVTKVKLGGTVVAGDRVGHDGAGLCVTQIDGTDTTDYVIGTALEGGAINEIRSILIGCAPHRAS